MLLLLLMSFYCAIVVQASYVHVNPSVPISVQDIAGGSKGYIAVGGECSPNNWLSIGISSDLSQWSSSMLSGIPSLQCNPTVDYMRSWNAAHDEKLGYVVFNSISYLTSPDGITWTWHNASIIGHENGDNATVSFIQCNDLGLCIGFAEEQNFGGGSFVFSTDLINWTPFKGSSVGYPKILNGKFFLLYGTQIFTFSANSTSWELYMDLTLPLKPIQDTYFFDISNGPDNTFLLLGSLTSSPERVLVQVSADGKSANVIAIFESESDSSGILYNINNNILVSYSSKSFNVTSDLGSTWEVHSCFVYGSDPSLSCSAKLINNHFIVFGDDALLLSSSDGISWQGYTPQTVVGNLVGLACRNSEFYSFFSINNKYNYNTLSIYSSADGSSWTNIATVQPPGSIAYSYDPVFYPDLDLWQFTFFNETSYQTFTRFTSDFQTWTSLSVPEGNTYDLNYGNGMYMLADYTNDEYIIKYTLPNHTQTWLSKTPPPLAPYSGPLITFGNMIFVILAGNQTLVTGDGKDWDSNEVPAGCSYLQYAGVHKGLFFCGKALQPPVAVAKDGLTWTSTSYSNTFPSSPSSFILFDGNQYVITFAFSSYMLTSTNGIQWVETPTVSYPGLDFSAWNGNVGIIAGVKNNEMFTVQTQN